MPNGPKPIIEQTLKTYYKGQMILKMPLSSGGGHFYFTKTNKLQVQFFRFVSSEDKINNPFNGYYEFIDMTTYKYNKILFKQGIRQAEVNKSLPKLQTIKNNSTIKSTETWLAAFIRCIAEHIIAIPMRDDDGNWGCYALGGGSPDPAEVDAPDNDLDGGGGDIDWNSFFLLLNPPSYYTPTPTPDPSMNWNPYLGGGGGGSYPSNPSEENLQQLIYDNLPPLITWEFEGDDGTSFIDNAPHIEPPLDFHPMDLSYVKFPKFVNLVKNLRSFVKGNPKVLNALQKWSGFSKQEILDKLIFRLGSGPEILVSDAVGPNYGKYNHQNARGVLLIDPITVNNFQQAQQNSKEEDALAFMLSIIILHEFTHFGVNSMGLSNTGRFKFAETGREFERMLFDVILIDGPNGNLNEVYIEFVRK